MFLTKARFKKFGFIDKNYYTCQKFFLVCFLFSSFLSKFRRGLFSCVLCGKGKRKRNGTMAPVEKHGTCFNHSTGSAYHHLSVW